MLRLLIVDDERAIRESIHRTIQWDKLDIEVIGLCKNGIEAYDAILDEYPDIVLTDIKMPGLSGLELIARVKEAKLDTQFVILSGYAEFEFAKEAMRWGVRHYLLKPTNPQQIMQIMEEVREDCYPKRLHTWDSLVDQKLEELSILRLQANAAAQSDLISQIKYYVSENLSNPELSLKWLAENHLYMNVDYLSKQFTLKTGEKFSAYLNRKRIERAKTLLLARGTSRIYEVATEIGCGNNPQYFSQMFKRAVGMTPTEYIRKEESQF